MGSLGVLERLLMDVLWDSGESLPANELRDRLLTPAASAANRKPLATTTVLTVLSRLETKGFVVRDRGIRPHRYRAMTTRAEHTAGLMHEVLGSAPDRQDALARFIGNVSPQEAETLRRLLETIPLHRE
ncbi:MULTISPECIES: BlaI/MecI/CopY family transcriptional regulator [Cryobacterium]|uniref:Transcriptional regulator n=1 Tax=Cryobacterium glucosi TaxID=1259175 RepID=A0ABY2IRV8_9MICO|nr:MULTISPECIES: BlaI/MecI/CopY family transcriptional regulator [Cryobacterium]MDY7527571.1 BlaI/MecI/CopY family transcriptional regulator [Cryobacterium sp. 10C2]MDY7556648.1 BlaI/MecI/CopY family transcriptional regulator [Cryobacterium sp. 10C3]MEB0001648.1 BlaI/MecI/CopY family transcriptional regulator [Cryobacterium sp. RTC2.1]MEB0201960.1 BlaI/MecI/CopY family transcriptional regulator [Cryobacterium sp. 5I3]MEB0286908.1 BlaI/MecI/CopY family transcriptional regulator [Cryobacterium s